MVVIASYVILSNMLGSSTEGEGNGHSISRITSQDTIRGSAQLFIYDSMDQLVRPSHVALVPKWLLSPGYSKSHCECRSKGMECFPASFGCEQESQMRERIIHALTPLNCAVLAPFIELCRGGSEQNGDREKCGNLWIYTRLPCADSSILV